MVNTKEKTFNIEEIEEDFTIDPAIIYSIIQSQAGTVSKAFLELVMNSIDANATKVEINFDFKTFSVIDNGKGFEGEKEVKLFFKTFGTPHEKGDAIYGRFRMGRGQIMAFATNVWRTNIFSMDVDVQNRGAKYIFRKGLDNHEGVTIKGEFYEKLSSNEYNSIIRELTQFVQYSQIPVFLNGNQISKDLNKIKWTLETDEAYIKIDSSSSMSVYNLGVKVRDYASYNFGSGGLIVSKQQLEVNFARNDILVSKCSVWKKIKKDINKINDDRTENKINSKKTLTIEERDNLGLQFISCEKDFEIAKKFPIFTDITGKHFTILKLMTYQNITFSNDKNHFSTKIHEDNHACVLTFQTLSRFGVSNIVEFKEILNKTFNQYLDSINYRDKNYSNINTYISKTNSHHYSNGINFVEIETFKGVVNSKHSLILDKKLTPKQLVAIKALRRYQFEILTKVKRYGNFQKLEERSLKVGISEVAEAWTDTKTYIGIDKYKLKDIDKGNEGILRLCHLIVHEYLHENGTDSEFHGEDFYYLFHEIVFCSGFDSIVKKINKYYVKGCETRGITLNKANLDLLSIS